MPPLPGLRGAEELAKAKLCGSAFLMEGDEPELMNGVEATANLAPMLGVRPQLGRFFTAEEDREGAP